MQKIKSGRKYSRSLFRLLSNTKELPHDIDDAMTGVEILTDSSKRKADVIYMPPYVQALHRRRKSISRRLGRTFFGLKAEHAINVLFESRDLIDDLIYDWVKEACKHKEGYVERLENEIYTFKVGANWRMIIFENLPKPVTYK